MRKFSSACICISLFLYLLPIFAFAEGGVKALSALISIIAYFLCFLTGLALLCLLFLFSRRSKAAKFFGILLSLIGIAAGGLILSESFETDEFLFGASLLSVNSIILLFSIWIKSVKKSLSGNDHSDYLRHQKNDSASPPSAAEE